MAKSYDISTFKILKKSLYEEVVITKFLSPNLAKAAELMCNTSSTSFSNEMSETRQE
jgi:hypothetical protein